MKLDNIKFPEGDFSHTDLARFNGKTNQTVWTRYLWARQIGFIVSAGNRKGENRRGKPQLLWRVNHNHTMAIMVHKPLPVPARIYA